MNTYGKELIKSLESDINRLREVGREREERISRMETDEDDCFMSIKCEQSHIDLAKMKIDILKNGGTEWFSEYSTLDGKLVNARWCDTRYGYRLRAEMPNGKVVWTSARTAKGLAKVGLKEVLCKRPAWVCLSAPNGSRGLLGAYLASPRVFPSERNYFTGEDATTEPLEICECS